MHTSAFSLRIAPELMEENRCPSNKEGAGNAGCPMHPWSRVKNTG
jgi:hypothetical protein